MSLVSEWRPGLDTTTAMLAGGLALIGLSLGGGSFAYPLMRRRGTDEPKSERGGRVERLKRPDGSELHVEMYGPADGPTIVLTHGWGANATEWYYLKKHLGDRFRLIAWDLPGLGLSKRPDNNDYSLDKMARDLDAVVDLAGNTPVVLLGHSIGGMISLTYCRLFPESLGRKVSGLVLVHTTPTNPVRTTKNAGLYTALQKPVIEPLLHLTIWLSPLVWAMNWMSYLNGSAHRSTEKESFAGTETRGQLDFATRFMPHASPAVLARGMFGMLAYDASATLKTIDVPVLVVPGDRDATPRPRPAPGWTRTSRSRGWRRSRRPSTWGCSSTTIGSRSSWATSSPRARRAVIRASPVGRPESGRISRSGRQRADSGLGMIVMAPLRSRTANLI